jgi:hypothetical protein
MPTSDSRARHAPWILAVLALLGLGCVLLAPSAEVGQASLTAAAQAAPQMAASPATSTATSTAPAVAEAGTRPPQFVVLSFDGAGTTDLWQHWRDVGTRDHAHFTFFLSGAYLLTPAQATLYQGPQHRPGVSDIGNLPTPLGDDPATYLHDLLGQLSAGYVEGHEIATHFIGHFCAPRAGSVGVWSPADWASEIDQFSGLLTNVNANNQLSAPVTLPFGPAQVVGTRTPCLEGRFDALYPVLARRGFRYDASQSSREGVWPERKDGIWSFPLASVPLAGRKVHVLAMDYNLYVNQSHARDVPPAKAPEVEAQAYDTFMGYFERAYGSNRAPVSIGAHFTRWNSSAYLNALTRFADDVCRRPEVRCVSYKELADWLDARSAEAKAQTALLPARVGGRQQAQ